MALCLHIYNKMFNCLEILLVTLIVHEIKKNILPEFQNEKKLYKKCLILALHLLQIASQLSC